jgi:hypothetical protein
VRPSSGAERLAIESAFEPFRALGRAEPAVAGDDHTPLSTDNTALNIEIMKTTSQFDGPSFISIQMGELRAFTPLNPCYRRPALKI